MSTSEKVKEAAEKAKEAVDHAADRAHESAEHFRERTHDGRERVKEKTHEQADHARKGVRHLRRIPPMGWVWLALLLLLAGGGGYLLGHAGGKSSAPSKPAAKPPPAPTGPPTLQLDPQQIQYAEIQVSPVQQVTLPNRLRTTGLIAANLNGQAAVMPRLPGQVLRVLANVGQRVRAGQAVAVLSSPDLAASQASYRAAAARLAAAGAELRRQVGLAALGQYSQAYLQQARILFEQSQGEIQTDKDAVNVAQAQAAQAQSQVNLTGKLYIRAQALYAHELISRQELEQAQANVQQAQGVLAATLSTLRQDTDLQLNAQKRGQVARRELARRTAVYQSRLLDSAQVGPARAAYVIAFQETQSAAAQVRLFGGSLSGTDGLLTITAPISGVVSARGVTLGQNVSSGQPLLTVLDLRTVVAQLTVYQEDLAHVRVGQRIVVSSNTAPGRAYSGVVTVIGAALDEATRTAQVFCLLQNPQEDLRPGIYVSGTIYGAARTDTVAVPFDAVQQLNGQSVVFTPTGKAGEFAATPVQTGETAVGMTQITSGLQPGQSYVSKNSFVLKSQMIKDTLD